MDLRLNYFIISLVDYLKLTVHPNKMNIRSSFNHPHVVAKLYNLLLWNIKRWYFCIIEWKPMGYNVVWFPAFFKIFSISSILTT